MRAPAAVSVPPRLPVWLPGVMLVLVTIALYWPATRGSFVNYDDDLLVTANPVVQEGLTVEGMKLAWFNEVNCLWHPLTVMSHMLDCQLFGLNPWGHHLTSVLLHGLNAGLVFALLQRMTGAPWRSLLVAALFAAHPLRVESVAWVAERRGLLSGFFGLLALMAYARYAQRSGVSNQWSAISNQSSRVRAANNGPQTREHRLLITDHRLLFYLLSLGFFACGLMSKPTLLTWPFVMLLLDYWPLRRWDISTLHALRSTGLGLVREKIPFFVLVGLSSIVTFVVQMRTGALVPIEILPVGARFGNALISYCLYLGRLFWAMDLAVLYPHPIHSPLGQVVLAGGLLLGLSVLIGVGGRRYPYLLVGWLWYCGTLVPVIQVVQTGSHGMADRYAYLPSLGVVLLVIWSVHELTRAWRYQAVTSWVAGGAAIVLCAACTRQQIGYWRDTETLFHHALEVTKNSYGGHANLGTVFGRRGQIDEAIHEYREALRLNPSYALAHYNLGNALLQKGQVDEAIQQYRESIRLLPNYVDPYNNLGLALGKKGQIDEAIRQFQQALRLKSDDADVHYNLGAALAQRGQIDEAIHHYEEALRLKPDRAEAYNNLGIALHQQGRPGEAIRQFQEALRLKPDYADARKSLDAALAATASSSQPAGGSTNR
jgi:protein O-mannosyl-transferase